MYVYPRKDVCAHHILTAHECALLVMGVRATTHSAPHEDECMHHTPASPNLILALAVDFHDRLRQDEVLTEDDEELGYTFVAFHQIQLVLSLDLFD